MRQSHSHSFVKMFTSCTNENVKDKIISSFSFANNLQIVCAAVAFGMGFDCPDVCTVIHVGAPDDLESYLQETGQAGRHTLQSKACLLTYSRSLQYLNEDYCNSTTECQRKLLLVI